MIKLFVKISLAAMLAFTAFNAGAQNSLKQIWATDTTLAIPESVLPDKDVLYVSLIDGGAWARDGQGGVGKVGTDGKIINDKWITGLNAPKGMAKIGNLLYVADLDEVVVINIKSGKIDNKIKITGAENLNDVTADSKGAIYVSDSKHGTVYKIEKGAATLYLENLRGVNGLKAAGNKLFILTGKTMFVANAEKQLTEITPLENGGDGIELVGNGDFLVTAWSGYFYYVKADGTKQLLLDTHTNKNKTADIGYDPVKKIVYVPTFLGKSVVAYQLQ